MRVYLDTSALFKLYVVESFHIEVRQLAAQADELWLARVAWAEAAAAFSRRARETPGNTSALAEARQHLAREWLGYHIIEITQAVVERAADYTEAFGLRAYDAVQLAAAMELAEHWKEPSSFACFDRRLNRAAQLLGMTVPFIEAA